MPSILITTSWSYVEVVRKVLFITPSTVTLWPANFIRPSLSIRPPSSFMIISPLVDAILIRDRLELAGPIEPLITILFKPAMWISPKPPFDISLLAGLMRTLSVPAWTIVPALKKMSPPVESFPFTIRLSFPLTVIVELLPPAIRLPLISPLVGFNEIEPLTVSKTPL